MEELIDLIATDGAPHEVSDKIKELLYAKTADKVDSVRPEIAAMMFGGDSDQTGDEE
jgi:hypothetical protein